MVARAFGGVEKTLGEPENQDAHLCSWLPVSWPALLCRKATWASYVALSRRMGMLHKRHVSVRLDTEIKLMENNHHGQRQKSNGRLCKPLFQPRRAVELAPWGGRESDSRITKLGEPREGTVSVFILPGCLSVARSPISFYAWSHVRSKCQPHGGVASAVFSVLA